MKKRIYIAGPLFSRAEREFNTTVDRYLAGLGYDTFLPQRDGFLASDLIRAGASGEEAASTIFRKDWAEIQAADIFLFIMDGRVPDEGACVELGMAFALDKPCIGLKTDPRILLEGMDNPLITGALGGNIARSLEDLEHFLR